MSNTEVKSGCEMRLLGLTIDANSKFSSHISDMCKRASRKVLTRLRNLLPTRAKLKIYKTVILPQLTYCHIVWNFCLSTDSRRQEKLQERALKAVFNKKINVAYEELINVAKLNTLQSKA